MRKGGIQTGMEAHSLKVQLQCFDSREKAGSILGGNAELAAQGIDARVVIGENSQHQPGLRIVVFHLLELLDIVKSYELNAGPATELDRADRLAGVRVDDALRRHPERENQFNFLG